MFAALALIALAASSASATNPRFHSESAHTKITGEQEVRNTFSINAGTLHCSTATFEGTSSSATTTELQIVPNYQGCRITTVSLETLEAVVDWPHCWIRLTSLRRKHIGCTVSLPIRVTAPLCTITVHPQEAGWDDYTTVGEGSTRSVTITATVTGLAYTQSSFCPGGGGGSFNNGTYSGAIATTCVDTDENHVGCWWSTE
jgi:hypothetical protein